METLLLIIVSDFCTIVYFLLLCRSCLMDDKYRFLLNFNSQIADIELPGECLIPKVLIITKFQNDGSKYLILCFLGSMQFIT